jgi:Short C-terminal domain
MPGLLRGMARTAVVAGTATAVSNRVSRRQAQRWAAQDNQESPQEYAAPPPAQAAPPPAPSGDGESRVDQLKELASLKEQGVLTEEEFASEKARILAS